MSNVYVVWYDNGESWEDNFRCIEKIFSTREAAEKYLDDMCVRAKDNFWELEHYTCKIRGGITTVVYAISIMPGLIQTMMLTYHVKNMISYLMTTNIHHGIFKNIKSLIS